MRTVGLSRGLFAVAAASLAIVSLAYSDSAPVPEWMPWRQIWVYGSALLVLIASAGLYVSRAARPSALTIAAYLAIWALTCTPQIVSKPLSVDGWYGFCEALTSLVGAWILYVMLRGQSSGSQIPIASERSVRAARIVFGLTCLFYGWSHFVYPAYTAGMVPAWLPGHLPLAYFTGLAHIAAGLGIIVGVLPRLAATLEAIMMSLFGLLVWVPSFFARPRPAWATPPQNQWSELTVTLALAASAWIIAASLTDRPWALASRPPARSH
jgi:uncharacterized membrane protein YphA (DoxX/SURF4 family)